MTLVYATLCPVCRVNRTPENQACPACLDRYPENSQALPSNGDAERLRVIKEALREGHALRKKVQGSDDGSRSIVHTSKKAARVFDDIFGPEPDTVVVDTQAPAKLPKPKRARAQPKPRAHPSLVSAHIEPDPIAVVGIELTHSLGDIPFDEPAVEALPSPDPEVDTTVPVFTPEAGEQFKREVNEVSAFCGFPPTLFWDFRDPETGKTDPDMHKAVTMLKSRGEQFRVQGSVILVFPKYLGHYSFE